MMKVERARLFLAAATAAGCSFGVQRAAAGTLYWDTDGDSPGASAGATAPGTWSGSSTNWSTSADGDIATGAWVAGEVATFSAGTNATGTFAVSMSGLQTIGGLDFQEGTVDITGTTGNGLTMTGPTTLNAASGAFGQVTASLAGAGVRITKTGAGTVYFPNGKTYSGGVTLNAGTLQIFSELSLGAAPVSPTASYLIFDGGRLTNRNGQGATAITISANRGIRVDAGGATFDCFPPPATTFGSWIYNGTGATGLTGTGTITKTGGNLLVFGGNNSGFTGKYVVTGGTIQSNNSAAADGFGATPGSFVPDYFTLDGGGLRVGPTSYTIHANRGITLGANGGTLDTANVGSSITVNSVISGSGSLTKIDADGVATLAGINTYTGDTIISGGQLTLADDAGLTFVIGAAGVNNQISGAGVVILEGDFTFDLSGASSAPGDSWSIVDMVNKTFTTTFSVVGFSESSDVWTKAVSPSIAYQFTESSGVLEVVAVPEPASLALLALGGTLLTRRGRRRG